VDSRVSGQWPQNPPARLAGWPAWLARHLHITFRP